MGEKDNMLPCDPDITIDDAQFQSIYNQKIKNRLEQILAKVIESYNFEAGSIYLENGAAPGTFELIVAHGFSKKYCQDVNKIFTGIGFSGTAAELKQIRVSEDAENDIRFIRKKFKGNMKGFITIPLISEEKTIGIADLATTVKRNFSSREIEALSLLGNLLGSYIDNSYQLWKTQQKEKEAKHLYSLGKEIIGFEDINTICLVTLEECRVLMKADGAFVILEKGILQNKRVLSTGIIADSFTEEIVDYLISEFTKGDHIVVRKSNGGNLLSAFFEDNDIERFYCIKLTMSDKIFGILGVTKSDPNYSGFDLSLYKRISWHLSMALSKYFFIKQSKSMAILEEQNRISRELHDSLAQQLLAMLHHIEYIHRICKNEANEHMLPHIQSLMSIIEMTYTDVRESIFGLRISKSSDETSFEDAIKKCIKRFRNEVEVETIAEINFKKQLPFFTQIQLLRIIQEALTNIRKHSHAGLVKVNVVLEGNSLKISISDNGIGFDVDSVDTGYGLSVMKERAIDIGAKIEIASKKGQGTCITLILSNIFGT